MSTIVYPATYNTSSTNNGDLNGTMVLSDADTVQSYTSSNSLLGAASKVKNDGGSGLSFHLDFGTGTNKVKYKITASKGDDGGSYDGDWFTDTPEGGVGVGGTGDDWEAVAIPPEPDPPEVSGISGARY
jgi:hypothetical protein